MMYMRRETSSVLTSTSVHRWAQRLTRQTATAGDRMKAVSLWDTSHKPLRRRSAQPAAARASFYHEYRRRCLLLRHPIPLAPSQPAGPPSIPRLADGHITRYDPAMLLPKSMRRSLVNPAPTRAAYTLPPASHPIDSNGNILPPPLRNAPWLLTTFWIKSKVNGKRNAVLWFGL